MIEATNALFPWNSDGASTWEVGVGWSLSATRWSGSTLLSCSGCEQNPFTFFLFCCLKHIPERS